MDAGFTKGPWVAAEDFGGGSGDEVFGYSVTSASGADILYFGADDRPETEANARLIAAAPELYEALRGLVDDDDAGVSLADQRARSADRIAAAKAALLKATGA